MERITVFTPTYNRAHTLQRVYNSLVRQSYKDFCWIIVDDGSTDNTREVVEEFIKTSSFRIMYYYQENSGKHTAINHALKHTDSELFLIADSDDAFKENALEIFINTWDSIDDKERPQYKGIIAKCYDPVTDKSIGVFPQKLFDSNDLDAFYRLKLQFEKWNIVRTDVMKEFAFPEPEKNLKFYPESVVWWHMAKKYKTRYVDADLRAYYTGKDALMSSKKKDRSRETLYLWKAHINENIRYFWISPKVFIKSFIGYSRDSVLSGKTYANALKEIDGIVRKFMVTLFYPVGKLIAHNENKHL